LAEKPLQFDRLNLFKYPHSIGIHDDYRRFWRGEKKISVEGASPIGRQKFRAEVKEDQMSEATVKAANRTTCSTNWWQRFKIASSSKRPCSLWPKNTRVVIPQLLGNLAEMASAVNYG
jgi:hypothetical protein